ncbi:hypothetical protein [Sedimentimonas flavescens]|uniref:hypothetical protein n=1 Tax=Sedimentimonas flavescens TaxID=2851012 RepID=UPI001C4A3F9B|nr:hypothetical protein [Sedimentimonas flavescens]MBW0159685.1 hypothetical protein [Sedimentimonas flavescens]
MSEFNRLTVVAAVQVVASYHSHAGMEVHEVQWDIHHLVVGSSSKTSRISTWSKVALESNPQVMTEGGMMSLQRAILNLAKDAPPAMRAEPEWKRFIAGLRFDGFEVVEMEMPSGETSLFGEPRTKKVAEIRRMLPTSVPRLDFREAESELVSILDQVGFAVPRGHLNQATTNFSLGNWAAANAQFRTFFESLVEETARTLGFSGSDHRGRVRFLGELDPPFLLPGYNEWNANDQKPQYFHGLMARLHPEGSHPGLSEEEDATFRFQIVLISARLLLRRLQQRLAV